MSLFIQINEIFFFLVAISRSYTKNKNTRIGVCAKLYQCCRISPLLRSHAGDTPIAIKGRSFPPKQPVNRTCRWRIRYIYLLQYRHIYPCKDMPDVTLSKTAEHLTMATGIEDSYPYMLESSSSLALTIRSLASTCMYVYVRSCACGERADRDLRAVSGNRE